MQDRIRAFRDKIVKIKIRENRELIEKQQRLVADNPLMKESLAYSLMEFKRAINELQVAFLGVNLKEEV